MSWLWLGHGWVMVRSILGHRLGVRVRSWLGHGEVMFMVRSWLGHCWVMDEVNG